MAETVLPSFHESMISPDSQATFLICFQSPGSDQGMGREGRDLEESRTLASQGEFFIGAGNVTLVTVALLEVGASVVLSNRTWPGEEGRVTHALALYTEGCS